MRDVILTLKTVFGNFHYASIAAIISLATFVISVWLRNFRLLVEVFGSAAIPLSDKLSLFTKILAGAGSSVGLFSFLLGAGSSVGLFSFLLIILTSVLFGVNASLIVYYFARKRNLPKKEGIAAAGGLAGGILGIGCASCGSFILTSLLASFGASGALAFFPLGGAEFGILGVFLLTTSIFLICKNIPSAAVCVEKN